MISPESRRACGKISALCERSDRRRVVRKLAAVIDDAKASPMQKSGLFGGTYDKRRLLYPAHRNPGEKADYITMREETVWPHLNRFPL